MWVEWVESVWRSHYYLARWKSARWDKRASSKMDVVHELSRRTVCPWTYTRHSKLRRIADKLCVTLMPLQIWHDEYDGWWANFYYGCSPVPVWSKAVCGLIYFYYDTTLGFLSIENFGWAILATWYGMRKTACVQKKSVMVSLWGKHLMGRNNK